MKSTLQAFFLLLAGATEKQLVRQVEYLKAENDILRSKLPKRIAVTGAERERLVKLGTAVGSALKHLITIVSIRTFARWVATKKKDMAHQVHRPLRCDPRIRWWQADQAASPRSESECVR